jgi:hypothetical protein
MHAFIELAEYRRYDYLAEAARERLAKEAQPAKPLASQRMRELWNLAQTLSGSARGALDAKPFHAFGLSSKQNEQTMLPVAR